MVYNFGIYEDGKYKAKKNGKHTKEYLVWHSMISRCHNKNYHGSDNYENIKICDEWKYFQNFANWFNDNYYELNEESIVLEKDFKTFAYGLDKIYSPQNCMFLPQSLNKTITFQHNVKRNLPVGVRLSCNKNKPYTIQQICKDYSRVIFETKEEAYEKYLELTYDRLYKYIEKYKSKIPFENINVIKDFIYNDSLREMHKMQCLISKPKGRR